MKAYGKLSLDSFAVVPSATVAPEGMIEVVGWDGENEFNADACLIVDGKIMYSPTIAQERKQAAQAARDARKAKRDMLKDLRGKTLTATQRNAAVEAMLEILDLEGQ